MIPAEKLKTIIESALYNIVDKNHSLSEKLRYTISRPSKYIRPILLILSGQIFKNNIEDLVQVGAAIELFHNFTLVHDDIMDKASLRRGSKTVHVKWDLNTAILSGDILLILAYQNITKTATKHNENILQIFTESALKLCSGQALDLQYEKEENITREQYIDLVALKTGALFGASMQIGALLGSNLNYKESQFIYDIGKQLGIAFQLQDDLFDLYPPDNFGKIIGGDILENKKTILSIVANEKSNAQQRKQLQELTRSNDKQRKIQEVTDIFDNLKIQEHVRDEINNMLKTVLEKIKYINGKKEAIQNLQSYTHHLFQYNYKL